MREAFNYMFKDNKYKNKAFIYFLYVLIANFCTYYANTLMTNCSEGCATNITTLIKILISLIIGYIFSIIPLGYYFSCIKGLIEQKDNYILPNFNFSKNFVQGLKYTVSVTFAMLVYGLGLGIVVAILLLIFSLIGLKVAGLVLAILAVISTIVAFLILSVAFAWIFSNTGCLSSFLRVKHAFKLFKSNSSTYWLAIGLLFVVGIVATIVNFIGAIIGVLTNSDIASSLISALCVATLAAYTTFVSAFLVAKSIKPVVETEA